VNRISQRDIMPLVVKFRLSEFYDPSDNTYKFRDNNGDAIFTINPNDGTISFGANVIFDTDLTFTGNNSFAGTTVFTGATSFSALNTFTGEVVLSNAANRGNWVRLTTQEASSSASIEFTSLINSTYNTYLFECTNVVPATDDVSLDMQFSTNGGSSYKTDAFYNYGYAHTFGGGGAFQGTGTDTKINVSVAIGSASTEFTNSSVLLYNPAETDIHKAVSFVSAHNAADGNVVCDYGAGNYTNSIAAVDAVKFFMSSGNIASGTFTMYGKKGN